MELRELRAFIAVAEEGGLSAAARRLHFSQSALSQTIQSLERQLGVQLLIRTNTGTKLTDAGAVLLDEARSLLAHHDQMVATVVGTRSGTSGILHVGVPLELPLDLLPAALSQLRDTFPRVRVQLRHLSSADQIAALHAKRLDIALVRERARGSMFDGKLVVTENLGVLLPTPVAEELSDADGVRLEALSGLRWIGFPRSESPAWYDQVVAVLHNHGVVVEDPSENDRPLIAEVKLAAVQTGRAFTLAPPGWNHPLPHGVSWSALIGAPLVRRTWAIWSPGTRRPDIAAFIAALELPALFSCGIDGWAAAD